MVPPISIVPVPVRGEALLKFPPTVMRPLTVSVPELWVMFPSPAMFPVDETVQLAVGPTRVHVTPVPREKIPFTIIVVLLPEEKLTFEVRVWVELMVMLPL